MGLADVLDAQGSGAGDLEGYVSGGLRGTGPAVAEEALGGNLSRCARDDQGVRLQGSLRPGPAAAAQPLRFSWEESDGTADSFVRRGESEARAH